jgi:hypothetical protein
MAAGRQQTASNCSISSRSVWAFTRAHMKRMVELVPRPLMK